MYKLAGLIEENKELLATIETWDNGVSGRAKFHDNMLKTSFRQAILGGSQRGSV